MHRLVSDKATTLLPANDVAQEPEGRRLSSPILCHCWKGLAQSRWGATGSRRCQRDKFQIVVGLFQAPNHPVRQSEDMNGR